MFQAALLALCTFSAIVLPCKSQCTVSAPTITGSNSDDICLVASRGSLTYTCTYAGNSVFWETSSSVFNMPINILAGVPTPANAQSEVGGVDLTEDHNANTTCITSTLTFNGSLASLQSELNGSLLVCDVSGPDSTNVTILVPGLSGSPTLNSLSSIRSIDGSESRAATLEWTPPTDTGGEGVKIDHYIVNVTGPGGYTCPPDQCNVTTPFTTITGLQYNTSYTVTVRAVNCAGVGIPSAPETLPALIPIVALECDSYHQLCPYSSIQMICTCTTNGSAFRWKTNRNGVFNDGVVLDKTGSTTHSAMVFNVTLVDDNSGNLTRSVLTYTPTGESIGDILITCEDPYAVNTTKMEDTTITITAVPEAPAQVNVTTASCDSASGLYQTILRWSDNTNSTSSQYYLVDVTSHPGFVCPPEQCNTTAQNTTITGLSCFADLSFTVRGANCAGLGNATVVSTTLRQVGAPTITKAYLANRIVTVEWMAPVSGEGLCISIQSYTLTLSNSDGGAEVTVTIVGQTNVSVSVASSDQYNISLAANTNCGTSLVAVAMTISTAGGTPSSDMQVTTSLEAAIPIVFLLTAIISSLITLLLAWLYFTSTKKWSPNRSNHDESLHPDSLIPDPQKPNPVEEIDYNTNNHDHDRERVYTYETPASVLKPLQDYETRVSLTVSKPLSTQDSSEVELKCNVAYAPSANSNIVEMEDYETPVSLTVSKPLSTQDSSEVELKCNVAYAPSANSNIVELVYDSVRL